MRLVTLLILSPGREEGGGRDRVDWLTDRLVDGWKEGDAAKEYTDRLTGMTGLCVYVKVFR